MRCFRRTSYSPIEESPPPITETNIPTTLSFRFCIFLFISLATVASTISIFQPSPTPLQSSSHNLRQSESETQNATKTTTVLRTKFGRLKGIFLKSRGGRKYSAFYNIPYALPPIGELRFEPPQEYTARWTGVRDATRPGERCIQKKLNSELVQGSEDCLYLSVLTPKTQIRATDKLLPVMVYFFGGAFLGGSGSIYGGDYFMDANVLLVLPEHRVGSLAYLNTEDGLIQGNMGFKDQVLVLRWIKRNIRRFGGDFKRVTIFGNSAGGMGIQAHIFSPMSVGLFSRAISQSGPALGADVLDKRPRERVIQLGERVGCSTLNDSYNSAQLVACLKRANATSLLLAQSTDRTGLSVEAVGVVPEAEIFLPDTPLNLLQQGKIASQVPWILGVNSAELAPACTILSSPNGTAALNEDWERIGPELLKLRESDAIPPQDLPRMAKKVKEFYLGGRDFSLETKWEFINMISDRTWVHPTYTAAVLYARASSTAPVYLYWLSHAPRGSVCKEIFGPEDPGPYGVVHTEEIQYLLPNPKFPYIPLGAGGDADFSLKMVEAWASFAAGNGPLQFGGVEWAPINGNRGQVPWLQLDEEPKMSTTLLEDRMKFWDSFELGKLYVQNVSYGVG